MKDTQIIKDLGILGVFIPALNADKLSKYLEELTKKKENGDIDFNNLDTTKQKMFLALGADNSKLIKNNLLYDAIQDMNNPTIIDDTKIELRDVSKKLPGKTMNNGKTKNISFSFMGVAIPVEIPLWHSGFRLIIDLIEPIERVRLINNINNTLENVGVNSLGVIYSNEAVIIEKIIWEFIEDKIVATTAKVKTVDELKKYIDYRDYPLILAGIIKSITPKGFEVKIPCDNVLENAENGEPFKCTNLIKGTLDANEIIRVNKSKFPGSGKQLGIKVRDSISLEDIKKYQKELEDSGSDNRFTYEIYGNEMTLEFKFPSIKKRFEMADMWLAEIGEMVDEIIATSKDQDSTEQIINELIEYTIIGFYVHMIDKVIYNEDTILTGSKDIFMAAKAMSTDPELKNKILEDIKTFINNNVYAFTGIPAITCSECNAKIGEDINEDVKDVIPLNLLNIFFSLSVYLDIKTT